MYSQKLAKAYQLHIKIKAFNNSATKKDLIH